MQLNKIFKGLVIALPVVTMMACSSTDDAAAKAASEESRIAQEQAEADRKAQEARDSMVETGTVEPVMTPAEEMKQVLMALENLQLVYFDFDRANIRSQMSVVSYGEEKPVNNNTSAAAFAENRRGVLVYQ